MRKIPVSLEIQALEQPLVYMNGGRRGLQVRLAPKDAQRVLGAIAASLIA
jgi:Cys-tRNA(Pro)/Cys-tRNA(Cys) deacylase